MHLAGGVSYFLYGFFGLQAPSATAKSGYAACLFFVFEIFKSL
jgi:hypothetical protein